MSQISKALKKVQELREKSQLDKVDNPVTVNSSLVAEKPFIKQSNEATRPIKVTIEQPVIIEDIEPPTNWIIIALAIGALIALILSILAMIVTISSSTSKQNKETSIIQTLQVEQRKINQLTTLVNSNKTFSDNQIYYLKSNLEKLNGEIRTQISSISSSSENHYQSLKDAILDDKQQINQMNDDLKKLEQKVDTTVAVSSPSSAASIDAVNPNTAASN